MNLKDICPEELIMLSTSISLFLIEKFEGENLTALKNLLCAVTNNISTYQTQQFLCDKNKK